MLKNKKNLDPYVVATVFKAFSHMKDNKMVGNETFFEQMEEVVTKQIEDYAYTLEQFSDILYAYGIRGSGSEKLNKLFVRRINEDVSKAGNYQTLANITWYLLFTLNKDKETWQATVDANGKINDKLPIHYYRPFRLASIYLEKSVPEVDHFEMVDKFFDPEQLYDYVKLEKLLANKAEYLTFKALLNARLYLFPIQNMVYDNAMIVHFCFQHRKIGINLWLDRDLIPKTKKINKMRLLDSYLLRQQGWEMLDISWDELFSMESQDERDKYIHDWFYKASANQEKNKVFVSNPNFV